MTTTDHTATIDLEAAEQFGERATVVGVEVHHGVAQVGVVAVIDDHLASAAVMPQHADLFAVGGGELVSDPHARELGLGYLGHVFPPAVVVAPLWLAAHAPASGRQRVGSRPMRGTP